MNDAQNPPVLSFHLNGVAREVVAPADRRLIDILRDDLGLMAAKKACGIGRCGACAVLMNDRAVNACLVMAWQAADAEIVTPEGLSGLPVATAVRDGLIGENAFQCGYCAPGFTVILTALFQARPDASEAEIRSALEGNICRCTGYHSIIRGALAAQRLLMGDISGEVQ